MQFVFYIFVALLVWFSFKSFLGGIRYLRFFREELSKSPSDYTPFATVFVPCRGVDEDLELNLAAILDQDYARFEVIFVVDDANDPAVSVISSAISASCSETSALKGSPTQSHTERDGEIAEKKVIVAPKATVNAQKAENLREAVLHVDKRSEVFVFVDSDARPSRAWLQAMVAPLEDKAIGAATGYRWYISNNPTFPSELRSAWNASIASALGPNTQSNFCWGGSTAMRREVFDRLDIRERWRTVVSDDFAVAQAMNEAGLPIVFVPQALSASVGDCTFRQLLEFTNRQMKLTRVYRSELWLMSFLGSILFCGVMISAFLIVVLSRANTIVVTAATATLLIVTVLSVGKSWLRLAAARLVLTNYATALRRQLWTQNTLWLIAPAVFLFNCIAALISRRITWRGTTYELKSPTETVIIAD